MAWWQQGSTSLTCPHCQKVITRKRGNLRKSSSLKRAVEALLSRHVERQHRGGTVGGKANG